jgi:protein tyrosine/serine phosphatase/predicted nucleotidyltransferase
MKQFKTIEKVKQIIPNVKGIEVALLYGSFGRNEANPNSDIDVQILVDENFETQDLNSVLKKEFANDTQYISEISLRNKVVIYFKSQPKVEFGICRSIDEINRNYLGSEITNVERTILFANNNWKGKIENYLREIVEKRNAEKTAKNAKKSLSELIDKFVYEFENCSNLHRRSDGFQFYFFYNIALHVSVQLYQLSTGETKYNFLPKNFLSRTLRKEEERTFRELKGTLFLPEANQQKRKLLDFFYVSIETLVSKEKQNELKQFLEWIYARDFLWNFRDISANNPKIKSGIVYRTATMMLFQDESFFETFLNEKQIKTVVDLRTDKEIKDLPYNENSLSLFNYVKAPFDPWSQSIEFQATHHYGSNIEIAYRFFGIECKSSIKQTMEAIINEENATAVHCHAGKDRTGILISLLHLLSEADLNVVYTDYLATEMDTKKEYLNIMLDIINEKGGIVPYLIDCGLQQTQVEQLKNKLLNGN